MSPAPLPSYETLRQAALARRDATFPASLKADLPTSLPTNVFALADSLVTSVEKAILALDATALRDAIAARQLTSVEVLKAFAKRAIHAQQLVNCLSDFFYEEALARAEELDTHLVSTGSVVGPLHGVPISLKDSFQVKGRTAASGWLAWTDIVSEINSLPTDMMLDAGAILYCKTTVPQSMMHIECHSYLGSTSTPYDLESTSGGSSGGEGALLGLRGSALGLGTDIGGSVRVPAGYNNLFTLKPTTARIPQLGNKGSQPGAEAIGATIGPMTHSCRDLDLIMKTILDSEPWKIDPSLVATPWRPVNLPTDRPLRVGFFTTDGNVEPSPPVKRALQTVIHRLKSDPDVELVPFKPLKHAEGSDLVHSLYFPDGGFRIRSHAAASGEPVLPLTEWVLGQPGVQPNSVQDVWKLCADRNAFRVAYAQHWQQSGVDVVLCPNTATTSPKQLTTKYWGYTNIWNLIDYPAVTFPTGLFVDPALDIADASTPALNALDEAIRADFDPVASAGQPIGLQLVGYRYEDEKTVAVARRLAESLGFAA